MLKNREQFIEMRTAVPTEVIATTVPKGTKKLIRDKHKIEVNGFAKKVREVLYDNLIK